MSINSAVLMGRITNDPELKQTQSGVFVTRFTVAVDRDYKDKDGEKQTDFILCVAWRSTAEFISRYFRKGSMIGVTGSLRSSSYKEKNDTTHFVTELYVDKASFTGEKNNEQSSSGGHPADQEQQPTQQNVPEQQNNSLDGSLGDFEEVIGDGDLPF